MIFNMTSYASCNSHAASRLCVQSSVQTDVVQESKKYSFKPCELRAHDTFWDCITQKAFSRIHNYSIIESRLSRVRCHRLVIEMSHLLTCSYSWKKPGGLSIKDRTNPGVIHSLDFLFSGCILDKRH